MNIDSYFSTPPQTPNGYNYFSSEPAVVPPARPYDTPLIGGVPPPPPASPPSLNQNYLLPMDQNYQGNQVQRPPPNKPIKTNGSSISQDKTNTTKNETSENDRTTPANLKNRKVESKTIPSCVTYVHTDFVEYQNNRDKTIKIFIWLYLAYIIILGLILLTSVSVFHLTYCFGFCPGFKKVTVLPLSGL